MSGKSNHKNREKFRSSKPQLPDFVEFSVSDAELSAFESALPPSQVELETPVAVVPTEIRDDLAEEPDVDPRADFLKFVKNLWGASVVVFWRTVAVLRTVSRFCLNGTVVSFTFLKGRVFSLLSRLRKSESPDISEEEIEGKIEGLPAEIPLPALRQENDEEEEVSGEEDFDEEAYENAIRSIRFKIVATAALIFLSIGGLVGYRYYAHAKKTAATIAENKPLTDSLSGALAKKEPPPKPIDRLEEPPLSKPAGANPAYTSAVGPTSANEKQSPPAVSLVSETEAGSLEQSLENLPDSLEPLVGTQPVDSFASSNPPILADSQGLSGPQEGFDPQILSDTQKFSDPYGATAAPELAVSGSESNVSDTFSDVAVAGNSEIVSLTDKFSHETVPAGSSIATGSGSVPVSNSVSGLTSATASPLASVSNLTVDSAPTADSSSATSTALTQQPQPQSQQFQSQQRQPQQSRQLQLQSQASAQQPQQLQSQSVRQHTEPQAVLTQPLPKYADRETAQVASNAVPKGITISKDNATARGIAGTKERTTARGGTTARGDAKLTRAPLFSPAATGSSPQETFVAETPGPVGISASPLTERSTPSVVTSPISDTSPTTRPVATLGGTVSLNPYGKKAEPFRPGSRKSRSESPIDISPGTAAPSQELVYIVQEGDNLFNIAKNELGSVRGWQELYRLNEDVLGDDAEYLKPGLELKLPSREALDFPQKRR